MYLHLSHFQPFPLCAPTASKVEMLKLALEKKDKECRELRETCESMPHTPCLAHRSPDTAPAYELTTQYSLH